MMCERNRSPFGHKIKGETDWKKDTILSFWSDSGKKSGGKVNRDVVSIASRALFTLESVSDSSHSSMNRLNISENTTPVGSVAQSNHVFHFQQWVNVSSFSDAKKVDDTFIQNLSELTQLCEMPVRSSTSCSQSPAFQSQRHRDNNYV